jgi:hypothetical protein
MLHITLKWRDDLFSKESRLACPVHVPWCPWQDLHLHWSAFEADVSALDYTGMKLVLPVGLAPTLNRV